MVVNGVVKSFFIWHFLMSKWGKNTVFEEIGEQTKAQKEQIGNSLSAMP